MRTGIKIVIIIFIVVTATGCTGTRHRKSAEKAPSIVSGDYNAVISAIRENNIIKEGFVIKKARIKLEGTEFEGEFGLTARLNSSGDMMASVKGPMGIEVFRIMAVGNDICGISKLTRTVYVGKKDELMAKRGLPADFLTIIFGDMPDVYFDDNDSVATSNIILKEEDESFKREISVCFDEMKVCAQDIYSIKDKKEVVLLFSEFREAEGKKYASQIDVTEAENEFHIQLNIEELVRGYDDIIEFNIPSYKRENL
jgi:hypothetical protein